MLVAPFQKTCDYYTTLRFLRCSEYNRSKNRFISPAYLTTTTILVEKALKIEQERANLWLDCENLFFFPTQQSADATTTASP
jgi:hypothetical protein